MQCKTRRVIIAGIAAMSLISGAILVGCNGDKNALPPDESSDSIDAAAASSPNLPSMDMIHVRLGRAGDMWTSYMESELPTIPKKDRDQIEEELNSLDLWLTMPVAKSPDGTYFFPSETKPEAYLSNADETVAFVRTKELTCREFKSTPGRIVNDRATMMSVFVKLKWSAVEGKGVALGETGLASLAQGLGISWIVSIRVPAKNPDHYSKGRSRNRE